MNSFYTNEELNNFCFKSIGEDVLISKKTSIYNSKNISIGSNVRIDDFCLLSGNIEIKNNVHISAFSALYGGGKITIGNYCGCSVRSTLISASDDFSGNFMIGATIPEEYRNVTYGNIILDDYVQLGAGSIVLPNVRICKGSVTGAGTLINKDLAEWGIYVGTPAKLIKKREKNLLKLVKEFEKWKSTK